MGVENTLGIGPFARKLTLNRSAPSFQIKKPGVGIDPRREIKQ